jgi:hypothetical protein
LASGGTSGGGATDIAPAGGGSIGANIGQGCTGDTSGATGDRLGDPTVTSVVHGGAGGNGSAGTSFGVPCVVGGTGGGGGGGYQGGGGGGGGGSSTVSSGGGGGGGTGSSFPDVSSGASYTTDATGLGAQVVLTFSATPPAPSPTPTVSPSSSPASTTGGGASTGSAPGSGGTPFSGGPPSPLAGLVLLGLAGLLLVAAGAVLAVRSSFRSD